MKIKKWLKNNCKSLKNKRVVITGATGGLGRKICFYLAELGADITLACRNQQSAEKLKSDIKLKYDSVNIDFIEIDFSNLISVKKSINLLKKYKGIDILINNAGVYNVPLKKFDSGFNNIFQINFLYQYYFTKQLINELEKKQNSICITMGSIAHNYSKFDEHDIDFSKRKSNSKIYGNSKRYLMFSLYELFKTTNVRFAVVHPGITLTNMTSHYPKFINWFIKLMVKMIFPKPQKAVLSVFYAMNNNIEFNEWVGPAIFNIWGYPKKSKLNTCTKEESKQIFEIAESIYKKISNT